MTTISIFCPYVCDFARLHMRTCDNGDAYTLFAQDQNSLAFFLSFYWRVPYRYNRSLVPPPQNMWAAATATFGVQSTVWFPFVSQPDTTTRQCVKNSKCLYWTKTRESGCWCAVIARYRNEKGRYANLHWVALLDCEACCNLLPYFLSNSLHLPVWPSLRMPTSSLK